MGNLWMVRTELALVFISFLTVHAGAAVSLSEQGKPDENYAPGRIIVAFKDGVTVATDAKKGLPQTNKAGVDLLSSRFKVRKMNAVFHGKAGEKNQPSSFLVEFDSEDAPITVARAYSNDPDVRYAEPDYIYRPRATYPNDPYWSSSGSWGQGYSDQWDMERIGCTAAWDITRGSASVIIAVVDSGIDYNHADIQANMWHNTDEIPGNGIDDDHNGFVDDYYGYNFHDSTSDPMDTYGHGTHVAGTIGAVGNNGIGIAGVNWTCRLMAVKGLSSTGYSSRLAAAIVYAVNQGASIINMSWGSEAVSQTIGDALEYAHQRNVVLCAAAPNIGLDLIESCPDGDNRVIAVSATDQNGRLVYWGHGTKMAVSAPGGNSEDVKTCAVANVLSLRALDGGWVGNGCSIYVGTDLSRLAGTSMACPHVAGVAALVRAQYPTWTNEQIRQAIQMNATDLLDPGFDIYTGYGELNAFKAVTSPEPMTAFISSPSNGRYVSGYYSIDGTATGPTFVQWRLEYRPVATVAWASIATGSTPVVDNRLALWNTTSVPDGDYMVRLRTLGQGSILNAEFRTQVHVSSQLPSNRFCSSPMPISVGFNGNAGCGPWPLPADTPDMPCASDYGKGTGPLWYSLTPTTSQVVSVSAGPNHLALLAVWAGDCGSLKLVGCSASTNRVTFGARIGTRYLIEVASPYQNGDSNWVYLGGGGALPSHDECATPKAVSSLPFKDSTLLSAVTDAPDDPVIPCTNARGYRTIWYSYTPATTGVMSADTTESKFDSVLAVWRGTCGSLIPVTCNDQYDGKSTSRVTWMAYAGTRYLIEVAAIASDIGAKEMCVLNVKRETGSLDYFTESFSDHPLDLDNSTLMLVPNGSANYYSACRTSISELPTPIAGSTSLALGDDSCELVTLTGGKQALIYGQAWSSFYVSSNGYVTFGYPDTLYSPILANHFLHQRISGYFADLDPGAGGQVLWKQTADRVAVTYNGVYGVQTTSPNTIQIEMYFDGRIAISHLGINMLGGIVGISNGGGVPTGFAQSDLSNSQACESLSRALRIIRPNGSEWVEPGQVIPIEWTSFGANWQITDKVKLEWTPDSGATWQTCPGGGSVPYGDGLFQWNTAGCPYDSRYRVRVTFNGDSSVRDASDADFKMYADYDGPIIFFTALPDTTSTGPYSVHMQIFDNYGIKSATMYYSKNGGPFTPVPMIHDPVVDEYFADIPGGNVVGDVFEYYVEAIDGSLSQNRARAPYTPSRFRVLQPMNYFTEPFLAEEMDLAGRRVQFTPDGSRSYYRACVSRIRELPVDPSEGQPLELENDRYTEVTLSSHGRVYLYGKYSDVLYVGSNGYVTFSEGDSTYDVTVEHHFAMPRISGLLTRLLPQSGGRVTFQELEDRAVVTWLEVPDAYRESPNTFQIEMFFDGRIAISYLDAGCDRAIVGLSRGAGTPADFSETDLSASGSCASDTIPNAKKKADGQSVYLPSKVVSAVFFDGVYVQEPNRSSGIGVLYGGTMPTLGQSADVYGTMVTGNGERMVRATSLKSLAGTPVPPRQVFMNGRAVGGSGFWYLDGPPATGQMGVLDGLGLNNIGLLISTSGMATEIEPVVEIPRWFKMITDSGQEVRVDLPNTSSYAVHPPRLNRPVIVTGVSSCYQSDTGVLPRIKVRSQADIWAP